MPVSFQIEERPEGSRTIWCSDHDPMNRLKGMHGVCLHPGKAYIKLQVRLYNRTPLIQTFLWWANIGVHVHELYQSFFPPDVHFVADHSKRATSSFPLLNGNWVGANYGKSYLSFAVAPGEHHVCVDWQSSLKSRQKLSGAAELTAEAGKTYYFRADVVLTQATESHDERLSIKAVDAPEGMLLVSKSAQSAWKPKN
jgi:hypothetical protein